ncbi:MAG: hypothetical protein DRJ01_02465 [Bacteroidetes bacterium]|nr:MAG: hypothetical protein DRJ01_02465 [Bacteroidota bacterium]
MKKVIGKSYFITMFVGLVLFVLMISKVSFASNSIKTNKKGLQFNFMSQKRDSVKKENPKIKIDVNKRYDDKGNIIAYDSTYSYSYTYSDGKVKNINLDSLLQKFKPFLFDNSADIFNRSFDDFFIPDSIFKFNFFEDDFFQNRFDEERFNFEKIMRQMDSIKNEFFKQSYPNMRLKKEKSKIKKTDL